MWRTKQSAPSSWQRVGTTLSTPLRTTLRFDFSSKPYPFAARASDGADCRCRRYRADLKPTCM
jgi:hypothetical protein